MQSMAKFLLLAGIAVFIPHSAKGQADLDALIGQVFGGGNTSNNNNNNNNGNNQQPPVNNNPPKTEDSNNPLECQCVPYYLCKNNKIVTDGVGLIDIRIKDGPCESYLDVCCQKPNTLTEPVTPMPNARKGCGQRNPEGVGFRIRGDEDSEAQFGEFPWMVAILREENVEENPEKLNVYQCGGALIHPQVVLTAAHCVATLKDPRSLKVRAGEWDTQTKNELFPHQDRYVKKIVVHPEYYAGALYNDIGLLVLEQPIEFAENVDIVCLPEQGAVYDLSRCFASGWGKDTFGKEGRYQVILKKVELPIVSRNKCLDSLRKTRLGPYFQLHESFVCAGGEGGKDTCKGDGGSPLVCPSPNDPNIFQQVGIVAWGIGCGENQTPGVYANVPMFRDWIDEQIAYEGLSPGQQ